MEENKTNVIKPTNVRKLDDEDDCGVADDKKTLEKYLDLYKEKTDAEFNAAMDRKIMDCNELFPIMGRFKIGFTLMVAIFGYIRSKKDNVAPATRSYDINPTKVPAKIEIVTNKADKEYFAFGYPLEGPAIKNIDEIKTKTFVETVAALVVHKDKKIKVCESTGDKLAKDMAIVKLNVEKLAAKLNRAQAESDAVVISILNASLESKVNVTTMIECAPTCLRPNMVLGDDKSYKISPKASKIWNIPDKVDEWLLAAQSFPKKSRLGKMAAGHVTGHFFYDSQKFVDWIADMRTMDVKGAKLILHTKEATYAIAALNELSPGEVIVGGDVVRKSARYSVYPMANLHKLDGLHILFDAPAIDSKKGESKFVTGTEAHDLHREYIESCKGSVIARVSVFQRSEANNYKPSFGMRNLTFWQVFNHKVSGLMSYPEIKLAVVEASVHWYMYPWTRIPLRLQAQRVKYDIFGSYDFRAKKVDIDSWFGESEEDPEIAKMMASLGESDDPEVKEMLVKKVAAVTTAVPHHARGMDEEDGDEYDLKDDSEEDNNEEGEEDGSGDQ